MRTPGFWTGALLHAAVAVDAAAVKTRGSNGNGNSTSSVAWRPCNATDLPPTNLPIECGTLLVPLDYTQPGSSAKLPLELVRLRAARQPSKGIIQFNFGGPGLPTRGPFIGQLPLLQVHTGGEYDLVAFDPRGTGITLPFVCDPKLLILGSALTNASDVSIGLAWAQAEAFANRCAMVANETGTLIGTAFTARDLMSVAEALDDGMLRYWGFSYGTTLGITASAMFPDRVGRVLLDGVSNPHEYHHGLAEVESWTNSDKVFSAIFTTCVENRKNCTLALNRPDATARDLEQQVWDLIWRTKAHPIVVRDVLVDYSTLKSVLSLQLYDSSGWPVMADQLDMLLGRRRDDELYAVLGAYASDGRVAAGPIADALAGIKCSDRTPRSNELADLLPAVEALYDMSLIYGDIVVKGNLVCAQWRMEAKERYGGGFDVATANPVLIVGNSFDGHTPLESARNVSSGFDGSVILEIEGFGHASLAVPSKCAVRAIAAFWSNGTLPAAGTVCSNDALPFSGRSWDNVLGELASEGA